MPDHEQLLFDDTAELEATLDEGYLANTNITGDCDCSGYYPADDDDDFDSSQGS